MNAHVKPEKSQPEKAISALKRLRKRAEKLENGRSAWDALLDQVNKYIIPYRANTRAGNNKANVGDNLTDDIFDATAPKAVFRFAGMFAEQILPENFFDLDVGPVLKLAIKNEAGDDAEDQIKAETESLHEVSEIVKAALNTGSFATSKHEMGLDLASGTGALLLNRGNEDEGDDLLDAMCISIREVTPEYDTRNRLRGVLWPRMIPADELIEQWPKGKFSDKIKKIIEDEPDQELKVYQYTRREGKQWKLTVWCAEDEDNQQPIFTEFSRTSPWIIPRWFVVPGEPFGRGPAMISLPFVKVLNKVQELALMAAAFAVMPIWMVKDDQVFNPDTARQEPGAFWTVRHTGGRAGSSIAPLPVPNNFDSTTFVIGEQRQQVQTSMFDEPLYSQSDAVRSPTEIADRRAVHNRDLGGVFGRQTMETVRPIVQRAIEILHDAGQLPRDVKIDQLLYKIKITSPMADQMQALEVKATVDWLSMIGQLAGPEAMMLAVKMEKTLPDLGRKMGVPEKYIASKEDMKKITEMVAKMLAAQQGQGQGQQQAEAPPAGLPV